MSDVLAFRDACAPALRARVDAALAVLCGALRLGLPLAFAFNGGKDSTAALHLLRGAREAQARAGAPAPMPQVVYFAPAAAAAAAGREVGGEPAGGGGGGGDFPAVLAFMESCAAEHSLAVRPLPGFKAGLAALVAEGVRGVVMGTRASDPDGAGLDGPFAPTSEGWPPVLRVCPLLRWSYADVWAFLRGARLAYCPLYDAGYTSLGVVGDSRPNPMLRLGGAVGEGAAAFSPAWLLADGAHERLGRTPAGGGAAATQPPPPPPAPLRCCGARCCCCCGGCSGCGRARRAPGAPCTCEAQCPPVVDPHLKR